MRYPGIIVCIVYTISSNAGSVHGRSAQVPDWSSGGQVGSHNRHGCPGKQLTIQRIRRSIREDMINHMLYSMPHISRKSLEELFRSNQSPLPNDEALRKMSVNEQETLYEIVNHLISMKRQPRLLKKYGKAVQQAKTYHRRTMLSQLLKETNVIQMEHERAFDLEQEVLSHIHNPPDIDDLQSKLKKMTANRSSKHAKLKKVFELLPEVRPIRVSDKLFRVLKLYMSLFKRERFFMKYILENFSGPNADPAVNNLLSAMRANMNMNPVQDLH